LGFQNLRLRSEEIVSLTSSHNRELQGQRVCLTELVDSTQLPWKLEASGKFNQEQSSAVGSGVGAASGAHFGWFLIEGGSAVFWQLIK
jgi:hypothetical protein